MKTAAALLALLATSAAADPRAMWGASTATLSGCAEADACVVVINRLSAAPDAVSVILSDGGLQVEVDAIMGAGTDPDHVRVLAPRGFLVMPPEADIPEDGVQVFKIFFPLVG